MSLWLQRAQNDLRAAELILRGPLTSYETASFHAQQAVEKALKALLIRHQIEFERTHNIAELLRLVTPLVPGVIDRLGPAVGLTTYAVEARYPGGPAAAKDEATHHLRIAQEAYAVVSDNLSSYLEAGRPNA